MWSAIFSQPIISENPRLRRELLDRMDYEQSYHHVLKGDFSPAEKDLLGKAIEKAYQELHAMIHGMSRREKALVKFVLRKLVARFVGSNEERGFLFTLNQDLLLETFYHQTDPELGKCRLSIPKDGDTTLGVLRESPIICQANGLHGYYRGTLQDLIDMDRLELSPDRNAFLQKMAISGGPV